MRISDWSSDVCSSDLIVPAGGIVEPPAPYEIILEAAIEEVAAEDVEDIVFDAIGQRRGGIEQRVKGALKITDVNDAAVAGEDIGPGVAHADARKCTRQNCSQQCATSLPSSDCTR